MTALSMRTPTRLSSPLRAGPIPGDELENSRIQLEHNLQHNTDLSLHLSSHPADSEHNYDSSVEYPRHNSGPEPFAVNAFASFDGDNFLGDMDSHSHLHAWSYRTADNDDEGVNPYGGQSVSTAAHHASALTLSAGLRGHLGARREVSLSEAEYDPDRQLGDMIAGVDSRFTMLDTDPPKSRYQVCAPFIFNVKFSKLLPYRQLPLLHLTRLSWMILLSWTVSFNQVMRLRRRLWLPVCVPLLNQPRLVQIQILLVEATVPN
jgi:hypothetical protein